MSTYQPANEVLIPLLNPNEPEALLAAIHVQEGQQVAAGDPLCTLETTKSTAELPAESSGVVRSLSLTAGQTVRAGERLCYIADNADWTPPTVVPPQASLGLAASSADTHTPSGLRITQPALTLARSAGLDLARLPLDKLVTEKVVQAMLTESATSQIEVDTSPANPNAILVYGGGGHGKALIDLLRAQTKYSLIALIDDSLPAGAIVMGVKVSGGAAALADLYAQGFRMAVNAVGGIGNLSVRMKVFERLANAGFTCPTVIHPSAVIEPSARLADGIQVMPLAYVGSEAEIGYGAIINTGVIVSHDCRVGAYANLSPGAILAGEVQVGEGTLIGMGATINLRVKIGSRARIGNGATVKSDLPTGGLVHAGGVWPD